MKVKLRFVFWIIMWFLRENASGKKVTDKFKCFVSPYKQVEEEIEDKRVLSTKYQALKSAKRELRQTYSCHGDILFLTDNEPQSLYP